jgi:hypothetical protein
MHFHLSRQRIAPLAVCLASSLFSILTAQAPPPADAADVPLVLHISAREVVIEVIARDQHRNAVTDLKEDEFQVLDAGKHAGKAPRQILSMRVIDPHRDANRVGAGDSGFRIS